MLPGESDMAGAPPIERKLLVDGVAMVRLLGPQDRFLSTIEKEYPSVAVHVRGNEVTLTGPVAGLAKPCQATLQMASRSIAYIKACRNLTFSVGPLRLLMYK